MSHTDSITSIVYNIVGKSATKRLKTEAIYAQNSVPTPPRRHRRRFYTTPPPPPPTML